MTEKEKRENDALGNLIQAAYDFSDEQLLADLEEAEAALSDSAFEGIEDRMYRKLMARMEAEAVVEAVDENIETAVETGIELTDESEGEVERPEKEPMIPTPAEEEKKVVRFRKRKAFVVGILAAAFVGMLGVTAIGEKNYFFRERDIEFGVTINNDKNFQYLGSLDEAYKKIENELEIPALKLGYIPREMHLDMIEFTENRALFVFGFNQKVVYFIQEKRKKEASIGVNTDRIISNQSIDNAWITDDIYLEEEVLENGIEGYAIVLNIENARYRIIGQMDKEEIINIAENLTF